MAITESRKAVSISPLTVSPDVPKGGLTGCPGNVRQTPCSRASVTLQTNPHTCIHGFCVHALIALFGICVAGDIAAIAAEGVLSLQCPNAGETIQEVSLQNKRMFMACELTPSPDDPSHHALYHDEEHGMACVGTPHTAL